MPWIEGTDVRRPANRPHRPNDPWSTDSKILGHRPFGNGSWPENQGACQDCTRARIHSGPTASASGYPVTGMVAVTVPVAVSMADTVLSTKFVT